MSIEEYRAFIASRKTEVAKVGFAPKGMTDAAEALTNATVGLLVSWAATRFVLGYGPAESAAITAMFFALSFIRAWVIRAAFRRLT